VSAPEGSLRRDEPRAYAMAASGANDVNVARSTTASRSWARSARRSVGKAEYGKEPATGVEGKAGAGASAAINTSGGLIAKGHPIGATASP